MDKGEIRTVTFTRALGRHWERDESLGENLAEAEYESLRDHN